jgi:acyl carrier protein
MDRTAIESTVRDIVQEQLGVALEEVKLSAKLGDEGLGCDSLDQVEILISIEEEFDLSPISDEDAEGWKTVEDIVSYVESHLPAQARAG